MRQRELSTDQELKMAQKDGDASSPLEIHWVIKSKYLHLAREPCVWMGAWERHAVKETSRFRQTSVR
jgi:hypothetical protein